MNERKPLLPSLATAFLSALILMAGCAKGTSSGGPTCSSNQEACGGTCVNVDTDNQNCGTCGQVCATGTTCQGGSCSCASGLVSCGGSCVASDTTHCGPSCTACQAGQVCNGGSCASMCPAGSTKCGDNGCSSATDSAHCGSSCTVCSGGTSCVGGVCSCAAAGQMSCSGTCVDITTTAHCGSCTNVCGAGQTCTNGACAGGGGGTGGTPGGVGGGTGTGGGTGAGGTTGAVGGMTGSTRPAGCPAGADTITDFEEGNTGVVIPQAGRQGWWYVFSDSNAGALVPNSSSTGPVMSAALPTTDPNYATCNKWAMHSTSSGHINFVGFGASLNQVLPPPPATATTTKTKNTFSATTAAYDGISFKIKAGSGTPPNVWFEALNLENQPKPDGSIMTAGGIATGTAVAPSSNGTDEYNTRGKLITNVSTTWQTVYVPFGLLAPRYLPAYTAAPCAAGNVFCEAPGFNPMTMLGLQFSVYDQFPKAGVTAGTYDLWVDDVAFYKGANGVGTFTSTAGTAKPFPQDASLGASCTKPTGAAGQFLVDMYLRWKARFVTTTAPIRVIRPENQNDTVSEGIGYGMLIAAYMGDRPLFDSLLSYWTSHGAGGTASMLMTWCIPGSGGAGSTGASCSGGGSATDADEDVAFALIQAGKQWGGTYAATAATMVGQIWTNDIEAGSFYPKGGNAFGGTALTNPSYFAPAYYRVFATVDAGHPWASVVTASYAALASISGAFGGGLVPAWCTTNCTGIGGGGYVDANAYQYDAHRVPWRIGLDVCWNNASVPAGAKTFLTANTNFFVGKSANGIGRVVDIYLAGGIVAGDAAPNSMSAIGSAGVGAMSNPAAKAFLDRAYRFILDASYTSDPASQTTGYTYFNATVGLITALTMSGNFYQ